MTEHGPWVQEDDYDATGDGAHLSVSNNATDYHSSFPGPTPIDATEFENAWRGAEGSFSFVDFAGYAGDLVLANVDGSPFPPWDPTTYDAYHGVDPLYFHVTDSDRYFPDRFIPTVPPEWDGYEWEDGIGWATITDVVLEAIEVNDTIALGPLSAATWEHQLWGTRDYTPPIADGFVPSGLDLTTYSRTSEYAQTVIGNTTGFYQRAIGHSVAHLVTDVHGSVVLVNTLVTASATMAAVDEGTYRWGSFIAMALGPSLTYMRYQMRPPRYRFFRENRTIPPRRLFPRQDGLGLGIGRMWPPPNTRQSGRGIGPGSPV